MVGAVILDIDGVIVGSKRGFNSPQPNTLVLEKLLETKRNGVPVVLCTARAAKDVLSLGLDFQDAFVAANGAVVCDSKGNIIKAFNMENKAVREIARIASENNFFVEFCGPLETYVLEDVNQEMAEKLTLVLQKAPIVVDSLDCAIDDTIAVMVCVKTEADKEKAEILLAELADLIEVTWTISPSLTYKFAAITAKGVDKGTGVTEMMNALGLSLKSALGVGDTSGDWKFIDLCEYGAAMGNATTELKRHVMTKGENGFIGENVDNNGLIGILERFNVVKHSGELLACVSENGQPLGHYAERKAFYNGDYRDVDVCGVVFWVFDSDGNVLINERARDREIAAGEFAPPSEHFLYRFDAEGKQEVLLNTIKRGLEEELGVAFHVDNFPHVDVNYPAGFINLMPERSCGMVVKHVAVTISDKAKEEIKLNSEIVNFFFEPWIDARESFWNENYKFYGNNPDEIISQLDWFVEKFS
jgi:hypothetical protein